MSRIKSVSFVPSFSDTNELTKRALFIATVTGTVGWEALCLGKSVLVFGNAWYKDFPGVTQYKENLSFQKIIENVPKKEEIELIFSHLMESSHEGTVDRAYTGLVPNFNVKENAVNTAKILANLIFKKAKVTFSNFK